MMIQYSNIKSKYPDCVLLFRLGDFYEAFDDDARYVSKVLGLVLTHRSDHPMAGIPHHALGIYLKKLIEQGNKVAICDQLEDPATAKGIVKRDVTRVVTPGTLIDEDILTESNNYIAAFYKDQVSLIDISTGDFFLDHGFEAIERYAPSHVIHQG
jgi:DNA mismatch repair protein MutS